MTSRHASIQKETDVQEKDLVSDLIYENFLELDNKSIEVIDEAETGGIEPSIASVKAFWGLYVDTSGAEWRLDPNYAIRFDNIGGSVAEIMPELIPDGVSEALQAYLKVMVGRCQARSVYMAHHIITKLLTSGWVLQCFRDTATALVDACYGALREIEVGIPTIRLHVSTFRKFYVWAALRGEERGWDGFSSSTAAQLKLVTVPSTTRGLAVRRMDPDDGPLTNEEYLDVADALRSAAANPRADLGETVAMSLMLVLGVNPESLRDLHEGDLVPSAVRGDLHVLRVPRIKKRNQRRRRDAFVERELIPEVGDLILRLIEVNQERHGPDLFGDGEPHRPLFRRVRRSKTLAGRGSDSVADQVHEDWFRLAATKLVAKYGLKNDVGQDLKLTPRRLRYTFMAREVAKGTPPHVIAAMMDHSDLRTLLVYHASRLDAVDEMDAAVGERLAPLARLFLGMGREGDRDALPGVQDDWRADLDLDVAPFACLSCRLFRPSGATRLREMAGVLSREADALAAARRSEERVVVLNDLATKARSAAECCAGQGESAAGFEGTEWVAPGAEQIGRS